LKAENKNIGVNHILILGEENFLIMVYGKFRKVSKILFFGKLPF